MEKRIFDIISHRYIRKYDKYRVELAFTDEPKKTVWLTHRQFANLIYCFDMTRKGYSDKHVSVIGVWNENGYYAYTKVLKHPQYKQFKQPREYDLSDLEEEEE